MRHFEMGDGQLAVPKGGSDARQPVVGTGFIKNQIADQGDIEHRLPPELPIMQRYQKALRMLTANCRPMGSDAVTSKPPALFWPGRAFT